MLSAPCTKTAMCYNPRNQFRDFSISSSDRERDYEKFNFWRGGIAAWRHYALSFNPASGATSDDRYFHNVGWLPSLVCPWKLSLAGHYVSLFILTPLFGQNVFSLNKNLNVKVYVSLYICLLSAYWDLAVPKVCQGISRCTSATFLRKENKTLSNWISKEKKILKY